MSSIRTRLFVILVAATSIIWLSAVCWIYVGTRNEIDDVLNSRLQEAAKMVLSLVPQSGVAAPQRDKLPELLNEAPLYEHQLSCQIWSIDGRLIAKTSGTPSAQLSEIKEGLSSRTVDGQLWRVYTIEDSVKGIRILVGDRLELRSHLILELIKTVMSALLLVIPLLAALIWASLDRELRPLRVIAADLTARDGDDMRPIGVEHAPVEVAPLVASLNSLLTKVQMARKQERDVTAFAAHELRTPLAGLRAQAQIALATDNEATRKGALRQMLVAVDRTARLVRQLLAMAKLDSSSLSVRNVQFNPGVLIQDIVTQLPSNDLHVVDIDPNLTGMSIETDRDLLTLAIRNLHENAANYMQKPGTIRWFADISSGNASLCVEDQGPGIASEDLPLVMNRFFRGRNKTELGSGLGLSIAATALNAIGAKLTLTNRDDRTGLRAEIRFQHVAATLRFDREANDDRFENRDQPYRSSATA